MPSMSIDQAFALAVQHQNRGELGQAEHILKQVLQADRRHFGSLYLLSVNLFARGQRAESLRLIDEALSLVPNVPEANCFRAVVLCGMSQWQNAIESATEATRLNPNYADAWLYLGSAQKQLGQLEEAEKSLSRANELQPGDFRICNDLGLVLADLGRHKDAIGIYQQGLPAGRSAEIIWNNIANSYRAMSRLDEAEEAYRASINLKKDYADAWCNLGVLLKLLGRFEESESAMRQAIAMQPKDGSLLTTLAFSMCFFPARDDKDILKELCEWDRVFAAPLRANIPVHANSRDPDRPLRIGYISPDFRDHCQQFFTLPLFAHHDHSQFQICCYSGVVKPDATTAKLRSYSDNWRSTLGLSDEAVVKMIREDQIDILIDLTMHMHNNRVGVMARKPAPIQVAWLAYPGSTGLGTMDYRLTDPHLDPPESEAGKYSEESIRLPDTFWCYDALSDEPVSELPAIKNGFITFGNLNNFSKFTAEVQQAWGKILQAVPGSKLLMLAPVGRSRQRVLDGFTAMGIDTARIEFVPMQPRAQYLKTYDRIDIGIDTFPCNGHTTSLDSYWMGVPVVTLVRDKAVGRAGWSQLNNLQLTELAGWSEEEYLQITVKLASDVNALAELRRTLRDRMKQSPLCDGAKFARNFEMTLRNIWRRWCAGG